MLYATMLDDVDPTSRAVGKGRTPKIGRLRTFGKLHICSEIKKNCIYVYYMNEKITALK